MLLRKDALMKVDKDCKNMSSVYAVEGVSPGFGVDFGAHSQHTLPVVVTREDGKGASGIQQTPFVLMKLRQWCTPDELCT